MTLIYTFEGKAKDLLPNLQTWIGIEMTQIEYACEHNKTNSDGLERFCMDCGVTLES